MIKILYKPLGLLFGALGGVLAGAVFKRLWALLGHEEDAPQATDRDRTWKEVLTAAALQGTVYALVKAAVDRGGAVGSRRLTGTWPD
jgi:predicted metal-dependent enzyme (double-stranded beta helix superfamily)